MLLGESWKESQIAFQVNSLENIILRCQRTENVEVGVQFISMVNFIQLAAKVEMYIYSFKAFNCFTQAPHSSIHWLKKLQKKKKWSRSLKWGIVKRRSSKSSQSKWLANGTKFAVLASAGEYLFWFLKRGV